MFVDLVNGRIGRTELDHLRADLRDEAAVAGAARGGQLGREAGFVGDGLLDGANQRAGRGQKGQTADRPCQLVLEVMLVQHGGQALLQALGRGFRAKAEVEVHHAVARDHVARARASVDVAHLPAGRREEGVAFVPADRYQFGQGRSQTVNRVVGQVRVGDVALHAFDRQLAAHRAASAVLDHVARLLHRGGLAHDAKLRGIATGLELLADDHSAVQRRTFFVTGQQKGNAQSRVGMGSQKFLHGHDHGRE